MADVKLCKDCRWVERHWWWPIFGLFADDGLKYCYSPKVWRDSDTVCCKTQRNNSGTLSSGTFCGPEGKFWEPKA